MIFAPRTKIYTVHVKAGEPRALEAPIFVCEGFSFWAFMFGPVWAIYHRLWLVALVLFAVAALFGAASEKQWLDEPSLAVLQIAIGVIVGYHAHDWRRAKLAKRGYIMTDVVASDALLRAQQRFFDRVAVA